MANFRVTWVCFDGKTFTTEREACEYEAKSLAKVVKVKEFFNEVLDIKLTPQQTDNILKMRKPLMKLLKRYETRTPKKGEKSTKDKDKKRSTR